MVHSYNNKILIQVIQNFQIFHKCQYSDLQNVFLPDSSSELLWHIQPMTGCAGLYCLLYKQQVGILQIYDSNFN